MKISSRHNYSSAFGSKNSPIKSRTEYLYPGSLQVEELRARDITQLVNFVKDQEGQHLSSSDTEVYSQIDRKDWRMDIKNYYLKLLNKPDGNSTVLVAKEPKSKKIKAVFSMSSLDNFGLSDSKTGYLDKGYVANKYKGFGLEQVMLYNLSETARGHFTDIIANGESALSPIVYKGTGFEYLDRTNPIIDKFCMHVEKINLGGSMMSKSIDASSSWLKRISKQLK